MDKCFDVEKGTMVIQTTQDAIHEILKKLKLMLDIAQICSKQPLIQSERNQYMNQMDSLKSEIDKISETIAYHELACLSDSLKTIDELLSSITAINHSTLLA